MADEEIVVEIEEVKPVEGEAADTVVAEKDPIADLQAQYKEMEAAKAAEQTQREAAERRAESERQARVSAEKVADTARTEVTETRLGTVEQGLEHAQNEAASAEAAYAQAMEAGNFAEAAKQQRIMARAEATTLRLSESKADLEAEKATPKTERREQRAPVDDPVEMFLSRCSPETAKWLRAHPDEARIMATNSDPRRAAKMNAAHNDAIAEGISLDTPEYFGHVEKFLGLSKPTGNGKVAPSKRAASAPVAPVQASGGGVDGGGNTVRLSPGEAKAATDGTLVWNYADTSGQNKFKKGDPIGVQEFARRKKAMQLQGQYDKTFLEQ